MRKILLVSLFLLIFMGGCGSTGSSAFKRTGSEITDPKWPTFEDVQASFDELKSRIENGQVITVEELDYRGFGPSIKNVNKVGYLELEKLLIGEKVDRSRLPDGIQKCTEKREKCYGLVVQISSLQTEGEESIFKRMFSGEKKTVARGWKFTAVFAVERDKPNDRVVYAYERDANSNVYSKKDEDDAPGAVINVLKPLGAISGFGF